MGESSLSFGGNGIVFLYEREGLFNVYRKHGNDSQIRQYLIDLLICESEFNRANSEFPSALNMVVEMVSIALPNLNTDNFVETKGSKGGIYRVLSSGIMTFPNKPEEKKIYLDVMERDSGAKFRLILNWENQSTIGEKGYNDTEDIHGYDLLIVKEQTKYKQKAVMGLRIKEVIPVNETD